jgi:hypothetical protein
LQGNRIDVDKHRARTELDDRLDRRDERHRSADYFVTGANSERLKCER